MTVRLVVDSNSDILPAQGAELGITIVPLTIAFGDETFVDGVDLDTAEFYRRLVQSTTLPTTAMPNAGQFAEAYQRLVAEGATTIISAHISSRLSGTFNAASQAAAQVTEATGVPIEVIDSGVVSAAIGLAILRAAVQVREGATAAAVAAYLRAVWARGRTFILLDTLEYLERGGRVGRAQAVVGAMLNIKPILTLRDGEVAPLERVRTRPKALARLRELLQAVGPPEDMAIAASDPETGQEFMTIARTVYAGDIAAFAFGPVVGTYAGPRSGGIYVVPRSH